MFIVGIDIAKRSHEAIIIAEDGQVVRKAFSFRNNCTGYNLLLEQVRRLTLVKSQIVFALFILEASRDDAQVREAKTQV